MSWNASIDELGISISDKRCWVCDATQNLTRHHALPQRMKPKKRIIVPLCKSCHQKLHKFETIYAHLNKMVKDAGGD